MAKKPVVKGSPIGYGPGVPNEYETPPVYDNNPDGPSNKPTFDLDGTRYPKGKMSFVNNVARGESPKRPDVNVITPDGISNSTGKGKNCQYNWGGTDGAWNESDKWPDGANLTGN